MEDLFYAEAYEKHGSCNHNQMSVPAYFSTALELHHRYPFLVGCPRALPHPHARCAPPQLVSHSRCSKRMRPAGLSLLCTRELPQD